MKDWAQIAMDIYGGEIPYNVYMHLGRIAELTEKAGGRLRSRQVIAAAIAAYEEAQKP